jgi:non-specific serine/threonine protein kinase/serine/threonine-protein kinase
MLEDVYMNPSLLLTATGTTEKAKRIREQVFELDNPFASKVVTEITKLYTEQGRMEESNKMFEEMRKVQERRALSDKVNAYLVSATDRKEKEIIDESREIAALHCEVFEIRAARYGADHPATLEAMENLAEVYNELGRITEAAVLDERVTELRRRKLRRV